MSVLPHEPWVLAATAADTDAEARAGIREWAATVREGRLLLATCHRVELYGFGDPPDLDAPIRLTGEAAARRLFRVAAGLESAVVGEDEILHQVREALATARDGQVLEPALVRLVEDAIATGRRVRAGHRSPKSGLADRALAWLGERAELRERPLLVVGTGPMGRALARAAGAAGARVLVASRDGTRADLSLRTAAEGASRFAAITIALAGPWEALTAASGPLPPVADLSSPPAVSAEVRSALGPDLLDIDQLFEQVPADSAWLERAGELVAAGTATYMEWLGGRQAVDVLRALQARAEERRRARLERALRRLPELEHQQREALETLTRQLVKDLLHEPLVALRGDEDGSSRAAARRLFGL
jgi:glutamyl-tRNA reductase